MEGSESSINRIGRTIWTVWGYLSGAVGRYLKPEVSNEDKQNGEDTAADVTVSKSYRELKEDEEEKERSEKTTWAQSESPQSGVRVRLAAVQWEKASIRKGGTSRNTGTGVAWNTGVQEGRKEGTDRKVHEKRDGEASDNNNEAARTKSNDCVEEAFVDAPSSIDGDKEAQDFGDSGSVEMGIDAVRSEQVISDYAEKAAMKNKSAGQGVVLEEPTNKCGFEDNENVPEALDYKVIEHTKDQEENEEKEDEQGTNQRVTEDETEVYTSGMADDLLSQLTHSTKQMEDLFATSSNEELKMDGEQSKTTETTEIKSEREVIEANVEETKQRTKGFIKGEQDKSKHDVVDYESNLEEAMVTACELQVEPRTAQDEHREKQIIKHESEPVNKAVLTPGKEDTNDETMDGNLQAGQQLLSEKLNICESKQDEAQFEFTEEIVEIRKELEPVRTVTEYEEILTPETEPTEAIEESKLVTVGTVKKGQQEADLESSEFKGPEIVYKPNSHESKLDESQSVFTEEMIKPECEALQEPATGQIENAEIHGNEPESFSKGTENDPACVTEESKQLTLATTEDEQQFAEKFELFESKLDESPIQLTEEREETECDLLEEPLTGHLEVSEKESNSILEESEQVIVGTIKEGQHKAGFESSEFISSEIADTPDIHKSKLDKNQTVFTEEMAGTECEPLEEPATGQMENAEIYGKEPEPISESTENETTPTTEMEPVNIIKQSNQMPLVTAEDEQQEAKQLSESKFAEAVELCESNLDESPVQFTEERAKTECDLLEEPVAGHMEVAEIHEKDLEPSSIDTENEAAPTDLEKSEQAIVGTRKEGYHNAGIESSEFIGSEIADTPDIHKSKLDENQTVFTEEMAGTECEPLEEPETGQMENAEIYGKEPEPISESTENETTPTTEMEPDNIIKQSNQMPLVTAEDEQQEVKQLSESKFTEAVELCESNLDESPVQFTGERAKTEWDHLEEPVTGHMEVAETHGKDLEPSSIDTENEAAPTDLEESEQAIVGTRKEEYHNAGFESSEFVGSEIADTPDIHKSKLDENQTVFTEEMAGTECEPLEEPETGQMENAEMYRKEPEPISESTENKETPTAEMEAVNIIKQSNQMILGTAEDEQQEAKQLSESKFAVAVELCESNLDESPVQFTEERAKTEWDLLEEPVTGHMEVAETHGKDLEPFSKNTENEAAPTALKESEQEIDGARKEGYHNTAFESSEFLGSEIADKSDIHKSKLDKNQTEFSEEMAGTEGRVMSECDLSVEHVTGPVEVTQVHGKDLEPSSKGTETVAALLPDSEAISVFLLAPTQEIVVTGKSEQSEADQQQLVSEFTGSDITENMDIHGAKLNEIQSEFAAGMVETECDSSSKMTFNNECVDHETVEAIVEEADQFNQPEENSEAGTTSDVALRTEEETLGDTICDIYGLQTPEVVIKQDSESVITLVTEEPGNQSETTEFQQEVRAEVAADVVKKSAVMERVHEQPKSSEHLALQETMAPSVLEKESLQEFSDSKNIIELQLPEEQISNIQRETKEMESGFGEHAEETTVESFNKMPSSSPQELDKCENAAVGFELLTGLTTETKDSFTAQKVEVLEVKTKLTAVRDRVTTKAMCEKAAFEMDASETESESTPAAVEAPETFGKSEASVSDETFGSQSLFKQDEWTVQDRSAVEPHGQQMGYSGELSLPESESALETSEMQRDLQKGQGEDAECPDETDGGFLYEKQVMMASLGVVNEVMRGLKQKFEERQSLSSREMDRHEKGVSETLEERVGTSDPNLNLLHTVEIRQNLPVEAMDIGSERERKEEVSQNTTGDDVELLAEGKEEKADGEEKLLVDSNGNVQERSRPGLKRGFEKMARNEESKPTVPKDWAGTSFVLQQVSSLDCTVQKSKIAVKNPHVRPPKDPRTLLNKASVEPLAPTRPSQPSPLRKAQVEGLIIPQKGVQGIGFKLPGLGAGFPALRKTDAGRKIRDEGETESSSTESLPVQKSDPPAETKEDSVKPDQPANKPKWTPPRHPGMGNPLMMSELKSKLKKTGKE